VYKPGSSTEICTAPLNELRNAYNKGVIKAEQRIGDTVVEKWDEKEQVLEVLITARKAHREFGDDQDSDTSESGERGPEPNASRSAGNVWTIQFTKTELNKPSLSVLKRIIRVLFACLHPENTSVLQGRRKRTSSLQWRTSVPQGQSSEYHRGTTKVG